MNGNNLKNAIYILVLLYLLTSCATKPALVTKNQFDRIKLDMTKSAVRSLLGKPEETVRFDGSTNLQFDIWIYPYEDRAMDLFVYFRLDTVCQFKRSPKGSHSIFPDSNACWAGLKP